MRRNAARFIGVGLTLLCALAFAQQGALPVRQLSGAEILAALKSGGYVLYFRHASTDFSQNDSNMKSFEDCATQRNLIDKGRTEARQIGESVKQLGIPIGDVMASPFCRTVETATLAFGQARKMQEARGGPLQEGDAKRYAPLRQILGTPPKAGTNNVVVSHGNPFRAVAGPPYLDEGEAAMLKPLGNSSFEVVARITVDGWSRLSPN